MVLLTDALGLVLTLFCWPVGLDCGLVDEHGDSADTGASVRCAPRVPFIVGDAGIKFENFVPYCTGGLVMPASEWRGCAGRPT